MVCVAICFQVQELKEDFVDDDEDDADDDDEDESAAGNAGASDATSTEAGSEDANANAGAESDEEDGDDDDDDSDEDDIAEDAAGELIRSMRSAEEEDEFDKEFKQFMLVRDMLTVDC